MAAQSDAADDLIAELAKLMAQDAQGDSRAVVTPTAPAAAATPPAPLYPVRIPGGDAPPPVQAKAGPDFTPAFAAARPVERPVATAAAPAVPTTTTDDLAEPFKFDFDFGPSNGALPEPAAPKRQATPVPVTPPPVATPASRPIDHDSIAELIAAELAIDPQPTPAPVAPQPKPAAVAAPAAPPPEPRQPAAAGWTATPVAANLGSQQRPARPALRAVNLQPAARSEQDRFNVSPVLGLGTTPAKSAETIVPVAEPVSAVSAPLAPPAEAEAPLPPQRAAAPAPVVAAATAPANHSPTALDPIDEIESLIGRAMRVELDKPVDHVETPVPVAERPAPSPALRKLATPTAPQAPASALSAADEAVLAAAQATGAQVGWVEAPEAPEVAPRQREPKARRPLGFGMTRAVAGPLVAVTLLLAAGFGLYWVLGLGGRDAGGVAPLLTADATPVKQVAPAATPDAAATQQSVVFNEIDGVVPGAEEQLVSRDQADVNEVTQVVPPAADVSEEGLANRKVRTVTVRPDGTIVSGDDSVAGSAILPVDRPNVPAVPGAQTASPELLAAADPQAAVATTPATTPEPAAATAEPVAAPEPEATATPVTPGSTVPAVDLAGNALAGKTAPVPLIRPAGLEARAAATPVAAEIDAPEPASGNSLPPPPTTSLLGAAPAPASTPAPEAVAATTPAAAPAIPGAVEVDALPNDAPAYAQLASLRSEEEARQAAQALVTRFGPLFGGVNMEVQRVDLGARGIYYRVRVPASSAAAAGNICTNVIAAGGDCVLM